jgi:hypothetical protein
MIYRKRIRKTGYSIKLLPLFLKIEFGKRVLYLPFLGVGKQLHNLRLIVDRRGIETVAHQRRRDRVTISADYFRTCYAPLSPIRT